MKEQASPANNYHSFSFWFQFIQRDGFVSEETCCFTLRPRIRFVNTMEFILINSFYNAKFVQCVLLDQGKQKEFCGFNFSK